MLVTSSTTKCGKQNKNKKLNQDTTIMKLKYAWVALIALTLFGCSDNTGSLGLGMFPESDQNIKGNLTTFDVTTQSELAGRTFAKTNYGYIGKFTDPYFGYYEAGFLAQLHSNDNMKFPRVFEEGMPRKGEYMVEDQIYMTELVFMYGEYFGDSLSPCRMSIYELGVDGNRTNIAIPEVDSNVAPPSGKLYQLNRESAHYTDINPLYYYSPDALIGRKAYTAVDLTISDSIRNLENFYPYVSITLPTQIGEDIYKACKAAGDNGIGNSKFQELFKGIYAKSDYGDGTVLYISQIEMNVRYKVYATDLNNDTILWSYQKKMGVPGAKDSIAYGKRTFAATKEIIQANHFKNDETKLKERLEENTWTFLKTPAGIYTQAVLPLKEIESKLSQDTINAVKLTFTNYNQTNDDNKYKYSISAPDYILLVREQEKENFFINNEIADGVTSYLSPHTVATNQYVFSNLTNLVVACLEEKKAIMKKEGLTESEFVQKYPLWDKVAIIPVLVSKDASTTGNIISVQNDLKPGYAKLKGGALGLESGNTENKLKLEVIYTSFGSNKK